MSEWLLFAGEAQDEGTTYILTGAVGGGQLRVAKNEIQMNGSFVTIKKGAKAEFVTNPAAYFKVKSLVDIGSQTLMASSCSKWACIGFVQVCCDDGRVEGACLGVSGC
jgi:hypothetical protein